MDVSLKSVQDRFEATKQCQYEMYDHAKNDLHFLSDDQYAQWDRKDYEARMTTGRPALTIDQLSQFVHQVENDIRMNTPSINVIPSSMDSDTDNAEVRKGLIRHILYSSNADTVFDTAASYAVRCSIGWIRVDHKYVNDTGFEQDLCLKRMVNPLSVYLDKDSIELDGSDAKEAWILDRITIDEFKKRYPGKNPVSFIDEQSENEITIAEYFCIKEEEKEFGYRNGEMLETEEGEEYDNVRKISKRRVERYVYSGQDELERADFPGKFIPIIPVYGEEVWVDGKRQVYSLIRKAKQAQQMFNYWKSLETELLMKQPNAPVLAVEGTIEDYAQDWSDPSRSMALRYKQTDSQGNPAPPPQRLEPPVVPTGVVNASRSTVEDIKATMGIYSAGLGQMGNEISGVAIDGRKVEGEVATYHFTDNLEKSIAHCGKVLLAAMPEIYDTERVIRIIDGEEEPQMIGVNGAMVDDQEDVFDLRTGDYDVKVVTGAPFTTRREEAAKFYTNIVSGQPELMQVMGDLLFKYMDVTGSDAMAERMKKVVDPKFLENEDGIDPEKMMMAEQLQQQQAAIEQLTIQLQDKSQKEAAQFQLEQEKLQVEIAKSQTDLQEANIDYQEKQLQAATDAEKLELERQKLILEAQKIELERAKLEANVIADAMPETTRVVVSQEAPEGIQESINTIRQEVEQSQQGAMELMARAIENINKPKRVVRDEDGNIIGSEVVTDDSI